MLDEVGRNRYLERLRVFERKRSLVEAQGNRQLSSAERTLPREMRGRVG